MCFTMRCMQTLSTEQCGWEAVFHVSGGREKRMSDLIDRKMAIDAISTMFAPTPTQKDIVEDCLEIIDNLPSAEPETIVRCKDCKHRHLDGMTWNCPFGLSGGEDFFCAYGAKDGESE